ncbi:MAG: hypothetical protein EBW52_08150, partial [Betaproteobacteria bacterium]|nr:hypothetical protein [Betaproteobacteria bacterium]
MELLQMNHVKPVLVFDLGGVVFDWNPKLFLKDLCRALGLAEDRADLIGLAVFQDYGLTADWLQFDRGAID